MHGIIEYEKKWRDDGRNNVQEKDQNGNRNCNNVHNNSDCKKMEDIILNMNIRQQQ